MKPRVTICLRPDGVFEMLMNEAGRDLLVRELQNLNRQWDHFHLDHYDEPELPTDVPLSALAYKEDDQVLRHGKMLLRPDDWDRQYYPHVRRRGREPSRAAARSRGRRAARWRRVIAASGSWASGGSRTASCM